jgi:Fur family zinc uptake transcriptional regulator
MTVVSTIAPKRPGRAVARRCVCGVQIKSTRPTNAAKLLSGTERRVCRHLRRATTALGAYEIQSALRIRYPNTVYRALEKLQGFGFVHRLESRNAFIACDDPSEIHSPGFIVCKECGKVEEFPMSSGLSLLESLAQARQFTIEKTTIELIGRCRRCSQDS